MQVAQRLYENGHITYMRTDSTTLSQTAIDAARAQVRELYGTEYLPDTPRRYESKVKNAQEAHEAIRPSGDAFRTPAADRPARRRVPALRADLDAHRRIADARRGRPLGERPGRRPDTDTGTAVEFGASGKVITFHGFLKAYVEGADDPDAELDDRERRLPDVAEGDRARRGPARRRRPLDEAAGALHRGELDQGARGPRDRPAVDVRVDHRHDPRPRLRVQARQPRWCRPGSRSR